MFAIFFLLCKNEGSPWNSESLSHLAQCFLQHKSKRHPSTSAVVFPRIEVRTALASPLRLHCIPLSARHGILGKNIVKSHTNLLPSLGTWAQIRTRSATVVVKNQLSDCRVWISMCDISYPPNSSFDIALPKWDIKRAPISFSPTTGEVHSFLDCLK